MPENSCSEVVKMSYLQSLSVFWAVVDEGSFSSAAKRLALTQPTISFHIDNLEKHFACSLFTRTAKGVSPTIYGQTLYNSTAAIQDLSVKSENILRSLVAGTAGYLRIGASTIPASYILPPLISEFLRTKPGIKIAVAAGDSSSILQQFEKGQLPIAIIGFPPPCRPSLPIFHDELILVANPEFPLPPHIDTTILPELPLIVREPSSGSRKTVASALAALGIPWDCLNVTVEAGGNEACKELIMKQVGVGFLSRRAIAPELSEGKLRCIALPGVNLKRTFYALVSEPLQPTAVETFWQFLRQWPDKF